jgi:hypothetical protein
MANTTPKKVPVTLPEGRVINHSLFARAVYKDTRGNEGEPTYKIELAFDVADLVGQGKFEDAVLAAAIAEWGDSKEVEDAVLDGAIKWYKSGDAMAADRVAREKPGDAYAGKVVIRAHTKYSRFGQDGPGGIAVFDEEVKQVEPVNGEAVVYRGSYGIAAVSLNCYIDSKTKERCVGYYLQAFQKTRDGEKLASAADYSILFKPVGRTEGAPATRRSRRG